MDRAIKELMEFYSHKVRGPRCSIQGLILLLIEDEKIAEPYRKMLLDSLQKEEENEAIFRKMLQMIGEDFDLKPKRKQNGHT